MSSGRIRSSGNSIYFVAPPDLSLIKIGITCDVPGRLRGLMDCSPVPLILLASAPAQAAADERALHYQFRTQWHHGEWFTPNVELLALIEFVRIAAVLAPRTNPPKGWCLPHHKRSGPKQSAAQRAAWQRRKQRDASR